MTEADGRSLGADHGSAGTGAGKSADELRYSQSLERGLAILRCFERDRLLLGIAQIADQVHMSRSTTHRYVITLVALGYLEQDSSRKYRLGLGVTDLGMAAIEGSSLRAVARPLLEQLGAQSSFAAGLAVLDGPDVCWLDTVAGSSRHRNPEMALPQVGSRSPAHHTAEGRVLVAFQPRALREDLVAEMEPAAQDHASGNARSLRAELASIRRRGFAVLEEKTAGVISLAAPVRDGSDRAVAALGVTAGSETISPRELVTIVVSSVVDCAERLSALLSDQDNRGGAPMR